jgi:hypothetical protein
MSRNLLGKTSQTILRVLLLKLYCGRHLFARKFQSGNCCTEGYKKRKRLTIKSIVKRFMFLKLSRQSHPNILARKTIRNVRSVISTRNNSVLQTCHNVF